MIGGSKSDSGQSLTFATTISASELNIRAALADLRDWLAEARVARNAWGMIELVVAEALNNICEHAYCGRPDGQIALEASHYDGQVRVVLRDRGREHDGGTPPQGHRPPTMGPTARLPEGGFGWFLIRELTVSQHFVRRGGENRLELTFPPDQPRK